MVTTVQQASRWLNNRRRMYRWPKPDQLTGPFFSAATGLESLLDYFNSNPRETSTPPDAGTGFNAMCYVCDREQRFAVSEGPDGSVNWRESVVCPGCGLANRLRSSVHLFETLVQPEPGDSIYITESVTPLYRVISSRHPGVIGSEYSPAAGAGEYFQTAVGPVRNEDVTRLSFDDRSLHAVLSFDVLEHVPDYRAALHEFHRVLATGGQLLLSVPFLFGEQTRTMARLDGNGEIEHLCEPVYHGDPVSEDGVLCFYEFGMDLLTDIRQAGFQDSFAVGYCSREWGYPGAQVLFVGRKRT